MKALSLFFLLSLTTQVFADLKNEGEMPSLEGAVTWLNGKELSKEKLKGKVVLIDFWTYSCINCIRTFPYLKNWHEKYKDQGLVIIGVHSPEFAFEKSTKNIKKAIDKYQIPYTVAVDSNRKIWNAFKNRYWPAHYFVDRDGNIRYHHFGEGDYEKSENVIKSLLSESGHKVRQKEMPVKANGAQLAASSLSLKSHETYIGFARAENFASSPSIMRNKQASYKIPKTLTLNQWGLKGDWFINAESSILRSSSGRVAFRFHARDLHLVLGSHNGEIAFKVSIDGHEPKTMQGEDIKEDGTGVIKEHRLYQLIRQSKGEAKEHLFEIEFSKPGVEVYAFTFG